MLDFTIYGADCVGNSGNCLYPNKMVVTDKVSFIAAKKMEYVTAKYKGNYRSKITLNFQTVSRLNATVTIQKIRKSGLLRLISCKVQKRHL